MKTTTRMNTLVATIALAISLSEGQAATIGYWRFEEGAVGSAATAPGSVLDSSGHGLNATPFGGPVYSSSISSYAGAIGSTRSMQFNGGSQRLFIDDNPLFQLTHSLTIEAFIKPEPLVPGTANVGQILFRGDNRPGLDPYFMAFEGSGNTLVFGVTDASQNGATVQFSNVAFDQWLFVAGTLDDATGQMKLYLNGNLVSSTTTTVRPFGVLDPNWSPGVSIGCDQTGQYGEYFNGWIDEVRLSNVALDPSQFLMPVPEPGSAAVLCVGAGVWLVYRRVDRRQIRKG